jgi:archaellum biogenesis protein FlaJ (TadC family)
MNKKTISVIVSLAAVLVFFLLIAWIGPLFNASLKLDNTALLRFLFVALGLAIVYVVYFATRENKMWEVGTRQVVYMAIGAALCVRLFAFPFSSAIPSARWSACSPAP